MHAVASLLGEQVHQRQYQALVRENRFALVYTVAFLGGVTCIVQRKRCDTETKPKACRDDRGLSTLLDSRLRDAWRNARVPLRDVKNS